MQATPMPAKTAAMITRTKEYLTCIFLLKLISMPVGVTDSIHFEVRTQPMNTAHATMERTIAMQSMLRIA